MMLTSFQFKNILGKFQYFNKILLLVNTSVEVILSMFFLIFSNVDILFAKKQLIWRSYRFVKMLIITKHIEIISLKEFTTVVPDLGKKNFVIYIAYLRLSLVILIYQAQKAQITFLLAKKVTFLAK